MNVNFQAVIFQIFKSIQIFKKALSDAGLFEGFP